MRHPLLLHSVSYAGLWGQAFLTVDAFLDKAASLGYDGVMLMAKRPHVSPLDCATEERARLRDLLASNGLRQNVLAGYCDLTVGLDRRDIPHREIQLSYLDQLVQLASDLGIPSVRIFTGYESTSASYGEQWNIVVSTLKEAARRAAGHGVVLGVQNHHDIAAGYDSMHDLLHQVDDPNLKAMFDAWAPALHGADLGAAAARLGSHTIHTTVADYQLRPRFQYRPELINYDAKTPSVVAVPMGQGFIDYSGFLRGMEIAGFRGSIAYEMCSPLAGGGKLEELDRCARIFIEWAASQRLRG
jgi:sugar phosphate isomerase/epimerase